MRSMMTWDPETSQVTLPPGEYVTTPAPELFPPAAPHDDICANTAQSGALIEVITPNATRFNPRAREGRDAGAGHAAANTLVSIHAPARGATV